MGFKAMSSGRVWVPKVYEDSLRAAKQKYSQAVREAEALTGKDRANLTHTLSKLGIFLEEAFGRDINTKKEVWRDCNTREVSDAQG